MINKADTWGLVLRTRNRAQIVARCVRAAVSQSLPPTEVIVVDASDDLGETRTAIQSLCGSALKSLRFLHVAAEVRSITHQLDQGIQLATADVVFSIDDDSIMYPNAAEEVMKVYRDATDPGAVAAVGLTGVPTPPDETTSPGGTPAPPPIHRPSTLRRLQNRFDGVTNRFIPYDGWRQLDVPSGVASDAVAACQTLAGWQTTSRRQYAMLEPPCRFLFAGKTEDIDFTYRLGRHGAVLRAKKAKVCHLLTAPGRRSYRTHGVLQILSMAILMRCYTSRRSVPIAFLAKRLILDLAYDAASSRFTFPKFRGACRGAYLAVKIRSVPDAQLQEWCRIQCWRELEVLKPGQKADPKRFA